MKKCVIFDFDGVIINSHLVQVKALEHSFRTAVGEGEIPYDEFFKLSGDSLENIFTSLNLPLKMTSIYRKYSSNNINYINLNKQLVYIFENIISMDSICVLCTGKERKRTLDILKHFKIEKYFTLVVCSDDVTNPKPHSESINVIRNKLHLDKANMIMVGDGINDIKCTKNGGIKSIAVTWGDLPESDLVTANPDFIVHNSSDLENVITDWINN